MHDQVGISADRRCEMGILHQVQAKVADIVRAVDRLALRAQHHFIDHDLVLRAEGTFQNTIE
ncbi:hypothetical protein D3C80_1658870 [compost metagenome]